MSRVIHVKEKEYYDSYLWEKTSYSTFIARVLRYKLDFETAILVGKLDDSRSRLRERWEKYRNNDADWVFWNSYKGSDRVCYRFFKEKLRAWMSRENAIRRGDKRFRFLKFKRKLKNSCWLDRWSSKELEKRESYYFIEVRYLPEIAEVFRKVYLERISKNEERMLYCEACEMDELIRENKQLKKELEVFNKWNPL